MTNNSNESRPGVQIHAVIWYASVGLALFFVMLALWFWHDHVQDFLASVGWWLVRLLIVGAVIIVVKLLYTGFEHYHDFMLKKHERKSTSLKVERLELQNEQLRQKIEVTKQLPAIIKFAMEQGHNIKVSPNLDLEVSNFLSNVHTLGSGQVGQNLLQEATDFLPPLYKMSDVLQNWQPSKDGVLLAKERDLITVPIGESLCHTTFTGSTDAGKTNNERMLIIQLLFLEQCVYLCDRNWQPFRADKKMGVVYDYTPIMAQLAHEPIVDTKRAVDLLIYLYGIVESRRTERRKVQSAGAIVPFNDIYLAFDELPAFAAEDPRIMEYIGRLLREARQYGVFFIGAAQDLLNTTLNNDNGAVRDNLLTNYYGGGDMTTARLVLNLAKGEKIDETGLGKNGVTYLRAKGAAIERIKARTPYCDDQATHMLLDELPPVQKLPFHATFAPRSIVTRPLKEQVAFSYAPIAGQLLEPLPLLQPGRGGQLIDTEPLTVESVSDLQRVVTAWNEGYRSIGRVMEKTGLKFNRSRVLIAEAKYQGLIEE